MEVIIAHVTTTKNLKGFNYNSQVKRDFNHPY